MRMQLILSKVKNYVQQSYLGSLILQYIMDANKPLRWGIIGLGKISQDFILALNFCQRPQMVRNFDSLTFLYFYNVIKRMLRWLQSLLQILQHGLSNFARKWNLNPKQRLTETMTSCSKTLKLVSLRRTRLFSLANPQIIYLHFGDE